MRKIIIDTDIGDDIDDAFALLCALAGEDELLGVTTVYKNTPQRAYIAKALLCSAGRGEVPVIAGNELPLAEPVIRWPYEKVGEDGKIVIHHFDEGMRACPYDGEGAEDFILSMARKYPHEITLIALGPYTNLARAVQKDREGFLLLKEAYAMGGCLFADYPEWNVRVDPEAADLFFRSGLPISLAGLNVTTLCKLGPDEIGRIDACRSPSVSLIAQMMRVWISSNNPQGGLGRKPTMHDPLCVLSSAYPDICTYERMCIGVQLSGKERGFTVQKVGGCPLKIAVSVDMEKFAERFFGAIRKMEALEGSGPCNKEENN